MAADHLTRCEWRRRNVAQCSRRCHDSAALTVQVAVLDFEDRGKMISDKSASLACGRSVRQQELGWSGMMAEAPYASLPPVSDR